MDAKGKLHGLIKYKDLVMSMFFKFFYSSTSLKWDMQYKNKPILHNMCIKIKSRAVTSDFHLLQLLQSDLKRLVKTLR